jgi:hypothetical protein
LNRLAVESFTKKGSDLALRWLGEGAGQSTEELMSYVSSAATASVWSYYDPFRANRTARKTESAAQAEPRPLDPGRVRQQLGSSATSLRNAFQFLSQSIRRVTRPTLEGTPGSKALARASVVPPSAYSVLSSTREVNETASAIQRSAAGLGLDVASPEAKSIITSLQGIGLDVSSAERSTLLQSSASLGLDTSSPERASVLTSTAEANTMPTSYGVVQATFSGGQTSVGHISGVYRGTGAAANATALKLTVSSFTGTFSSAAPSLVRINVTDQNNADLGSYFGFVRAGESLSLGADIGLSIAFTAGSYRAGATTTFAVSNSTPTNVNPDAFFNAPSVNDRPRFENGAQVTPGSFTVNGTSIQVLANDSINTVIQRINATVAGITATFQNDRVVIQSTGPSEDDIVLGNDTSGFFTALKLNGASTVRGNVRDDQQLFAKTSQFASVTAGSFRVNGQTILVDPLAHSLQTVLDQINSSSAGVSAAYNTNSARIVLTSTGASEDPIVVDNDTTGFLAAAGLATTNSVPGNIRDDRQVLAKVSAFTSVTSGSFQVNGTEISVDSLTDTLDMIVARINASVLGLEATYDSTEDKLVFTSTGNSEGEILLTDDSSGFLGAARLEGASTVRGNVRDDVQMLSKVTQLSSVIAGSFQINGVTISIDPSTDSLNAILSRINSSGAGVTATYDAAENRVVLDPGNNALVLENDSSGFITAVQIATGSFAVRVNANAAFNGTGINAPHFESEFSVTPGSFTINGVEIAVNAADSVNTVLNRINNSNAGVIATFDAASETVRLHSRETGPQDIVLGSDTSGFLAAAKLDGTALFSRGNNARQMQLRDSLPGASDGIIRINDQLVAIDPDADTLTTLAGKLDALDGVEAFLDGETGALTIRSETEGGSLAIADSSGTLAALGINDAIYTGQASTLRTVQSKNSKFQLDYRDKVVDQIMETIAAVNQTLESLQKATGLSLTFRDDIQDAVRDAVADISDSRKKGLTVANQANAPLTLKAERSLIANALRQNVRALDEFFEGEDNLPDALEKLMDRAERSIAIAPEAAPAPRPAPAPAVTEDFFKVASASQLYLIDSMATGALTPSGTSPVVGPDEPDPSRHMESSRSFSRAPGRTGGAAADDDGRWSSAAYLA